MIFGRTQALITTAVLIRASLSTALSIPTRTFGTQISGESLSKSTTASDVLSFLKRENRLSPYASGGTAIVTGGASGIGAVTVQTLADAGMTVIVCARNVPAAEEARQKLTASARERVIVRRLDLADLNSVKACAEKIREMEGPIDLLVNNAGIMATPFEKTEQGFELQFGTNHVGHHYLTRLILPCMSEGGRVVSLASTAHEFGNLDFSDLQYTRGKRKYSPWGAYGQSKLANLLFAKGLNDRLQEEKESVDSDGIFSVSLHPGVIKTNLWRNTNPFFQFMTNIIADKNQDQGAATTVYCGLVDSSFLEGGGYYKDCDISPGSNAAQDEYKGRRNDLWDATEKMIIEAGFDLPSFLL